MISLPVIQPSGNVTIGTHPTFEKKEFCNECKKVHDFERCPVCNSYIDLGFGLAYGGMGMYKMCKSPTCNWYWKELIPVDES